MLDQPQNGTISTDNTIYETSVTYSCDEGFELNLADVVKTCQANKTWSSTEDVTCNSKYYFKLLKQYDESAIVRTQTVWFITL